MWLVTLKSECFSFAPLKRDHIPRTYRSTRPFRLQLHYDGSGVRAGVCIHVPPSALILWTFELNMVDDEFG